MALSEAHRLWRQRNAAHLNAKNKEYRQRNRALLAAKQRAYIAANYELVRERKRKYREANKAKITEYTRRTSAARRAYYFRVKYGIEVAHFNAMVEKQQHRCGICNLAKKLVVDHCHATKVIRGLLCTECNKGLGLLGDTEGDLLLALRYLRGLNR